MTDQITHVWDYATGPSCGNRTAISGECMIDCKRRYGGCILSPEERQAAIEKRRASFQTETPK